MALAELPKDPAATLDYELDWSPYLGDDDTIATSAWDGGGLTVVADTSTTLSAFVRLSGGTAGTKYTVKNTVTLASGQTDVRRITIVVQEM